MKALERANLELENAINSLNSIINSYDNEEIETGYNNIDDIEERLFKIKVLVSMVFYQRKFLHFWQMWKLVCILLKLEKNLGNLQEAAKNTKKIIKFSTRFKQVSQRKSFGN